MSNSPNSANPFATGNLTGRYLFWYTDAAGNKLQQLSRFAFANFTRVVNGTGILTIGLPMAAYGDIFRKDYRIEVWRAPNGVPTRRLENIFFMQRPHIYTRESDGVTILEMAGHDPFGLLERRIVKYYAGEAQTSKSGAIDDIMKEIVDENMGAAAFTDDPDRAIPYDKGYFTVQGATSLGASVTKSFAYRNVHDIIAELANQSRVDTPEIYYDVVPITTTTFQFQTFVNQRGADRRFSSGNTAMVFSLKKGSLESPSYEKSYFGSANVVYAGGQGVDNARNVQERQDESLEVESIWARAEAFRSAVNETTTAGVQSAGDAELAERRPRLSFNTNFVEAPGAIYGVDWDFGDRVTVDYAGQLIDATVRVVYFSVNENGEETLYARAEFGEFAQ